jgi:hypothetical protein
VSGKEVQSLLLGKIQHHPYKKVQASFKQFLEEEDEEEKILQPEIS